MKGDFNKAVRGYQLRLTPEADAEKGMFRFEEELQAAAFEKLRHTIKTDFFVRLSRPSQVESFPAVDPFLEIRARQKDMMKLRDVFRGTLQSITYIGHEETDPTLRKRREFRQKRPYRWKNV